MSKTNGKTRGRAVEIHAAMGEGYRLTNTQNGWSVLVRDRADGMRDVLAVSPRGKVAREVQTAAGVAVAG